jgi:DNA-directed RNA polymerase II subunit RPB11
MNAPERSQSYILEPGEPKISHVLDTRISSAANFQINKEDHTIGNLLKADLVRNKRVIFAAYQHPHPLQNYINLKVQTDGSKTPLKELIATCKNLGTLTDVLEEEFVEKLKKFEEEAQNTESRNAYD